MTDAPATAAPRRTSKLFWLALALAVLVVAVDQLSKWWAVTTLSDGKVIPFIGDAIRFQLVYNPGAAFSLGEGFTWIFAIVAAVAVVGIAWYLWRVRSLAWTIVLGLLLGGAATHLGDRLFREPGFARGHVVDFIAYGNWFIGNIADIVIVGCAVAGVLLALFKVRTGRDADVTA